MRAATNEELHSTHWPNAGNRRVLLRDIAIVLFAALLAGFICMRFDVNEALFDWTRNFEGLQFDELPIVMLVLATGFIWFALRRYRDAGVMLAQQQVIDTRLSIALAENRRLSQQYLSVQESERKNLARELHDELGQYLNAIKIDAISIRDECQQENIGIREASIAITRNVDHVYAVVTELIRRLRPVGLDDLGLLAAIEHCIDQWRQRLPAMNISMSAHGDLSDLSEQANLTLYRLTQESLTNAAKHASAENIIIELNRSQSMSGESKVAIRIVDDGAGVNLQEPKSGFGLVSMRERVEMQGGSFAIRSAPAQGFELSAHFPA